MQTQNADELLENEDQGDWELLIEAVRSRELLCDQTSKGFKNTARKELLWIEISTEIKKDVTWCKTKWKYLRDQYMRKKKNLKGKSGQAAKKAQRWHYFELLSFLNTSIEDAETTGNISTSPVRVPENSEMSAEPTEKECIESGNELSASQLPTKRPKKEKEAPDAVDEALINYLQHRSEDKNKIKDSHHHFANGIAQQLREMPPTLASFAKFRIQQVMYECECSQFPQPEVVVHQNENIK